MFEGISFFNSLLFKCLFLITGFLGLGFYSAPMLLWSVYILVLMWLLSVPTFLIFAVLLILLVCNIPSLRKLFLTRNIMKVMNALNIIPKISETEKIALEAGSTWVDGQLFSGNPNFDQILSEPYPQLRKEEKDFINNQCRRLCDLMDDDQAYEDGDLSTEVWAFLKKEKFMGIVIPKEYGGLGFSALGHSEIINTVSGCSLPLAISIMVPNSLGPAELLVHYGTKEQKDHYLPRLASGEEIPCFGLTEPNAGSDAGSISSQAVVFKGDDGKLYLRMNWKKRWITLGAASTLLGVAVKLYDPDNLLGKGKNVGITCVLVPKETPGVVLGLRHDPLGVPFINSPIAGHDVVVSLDQIIGGVDGAGKGWKMLMECLAAGRSISLPSQACGGAKHVAKVTGAYAQVRQQFGMSIGNFEGVDEAIARIGAFSYLLEASRVFTAGAVDSGLKPAVVSAIVKYHSTEISRKVVNDAMDVFGGAGITLGPKNLLARKYIAVPIAITVEGANILTRTMIIFGQGAIRCHPFAYKQVIALSENNVDDFDKAFTGHISHIFTNCARSLLLSLTRGSLAKSPKSNMSSYYKKISWASASFAFVADVAMASLGGKLKFKEKLAGRFADILSWMYLLSATLRRYEAAKVCKEEEDYVHYICQFGLNEIQKAFEGIYSNLEIPVLGLVFKKIIAPWSRFNSFSRAPSDELGTKVAQSLMKPGTLRDIVAGSMEDTDINGRATLDLEEAFHLSYQSKQILKKISQGMKEGVISRDKPIRKIEEALKAQVISVEDVELLKKAKVECDQAIQVDSIPVEKYRKGTLNLFDA